jgi:methionyl-tRNA synthetase
MEFGYNDAAADGRKYEITSQVVANEFLNFGADKFSKSRGNLIEIGWFVEKYGAESLRYYLTAVAPEENDSTFTWEDYARRYNGELADILGNFVHRTLTFTHKYFDAKIPEGAPSGDGENKLRAEITAALSESAKHLDGLRFKAGLARLMDLARAGNKFFDEKAPWSQRKTDLNACGTTIRVCCEVAAALGIGLRPFLPASAPKILKSFGLSAEDAFKPGSASLDPRSITKPGTPLAPPEVPFKKLEEKDLPAPS